MHDVFPPPFIYIVSEVSLLQDDFGSAFVRLIVSPISSAQLDPVYVCEPQSLLPELSMIEIDQISDALNPC